MAAVHCSRLRGPYRRTSNSDPRRIGEVAVQPLDEAAFEGSGFGGSARQPARLSASGALREEPAPVRGQPLIGDERHEREEVGTDPPEDGDDLGGRRAVRSDEDEAAAVGGDADAMGAGEIERLGQGQRPTANFSNCSWFRRPGVRK